MGTKIENKCHLVSSLTLDSRQFITFILTLLLSLTSDAGGRLRSLRAVSFAYCRIQSKNIKGHPSPNKTLKKIIISQYSPYLLTERSRVVDFSNKEHEKIPQTVVQERMCGG